MKTNDGKDMIGKHEMTAASPKRRALFKKLAIGGGISAAVTAMPAKWIKPVVDIVVLPAHAECTLFCDVTLSITGRAVPPLLCSSGTSLIEPLVLSGEASTGCGPVEIISINSILPSGASFTSTLSVGSTSTLAPGGTFQIDISGYPSTSPFTCDPAESGVITIEYQCVGIDTESSMLAIDIVEQILLGQASNASPKISEMAEEQSTPLEQKDAESNQLEDTPEEQDESAADTSEEPQELDELAGDAVEDPSSQNEDSESAGDSPEEGDAGDEELEDTSEQNEEAGETSEDPAAESVIPIAVTAE